MTATSALQQAEQEKAIADVKRGEVAAQATQSSIQIATQQAAYLNSQATQQALDRLGTGKAALALVFVSQEFNISEVLASTPRI